MTQITNPAHKKKVLDALQEMSASMTRVEAERDLMKHIIDDLHEETEIEKKIIRRMAKTYHKQNFTETISEDEEFELIYSNITGEMV